MNVKIWELYPELAKAVNDEHERVGLTASGHDVDHDLEVGQLAYMVAQPEDERAARLAGVGGLLHSIDRILEVELKLKKENISVVPIKEIKGYGIALLADFTDVRSKEIDRVIQAVIHHGSKPNHPDDDLVMIAVADADRLANMGASLPIRSGQHNNKVRLLNPYTMEVDPSDRSPREKYMNPDSVLWDIANCIGWMKTEGPYIIRLPKAREIGAKRAERLQRHIDGIREERIELGLLPYPAL